MACPDIGALRGWLDAGPSEVDPAVEQHICDCESCQDALAVMRVNASFAATAIASLAFDPPREFALVERSSDTAVKPAPIERKPMISSNRWRVALVGTAAAVLLGLVAGTPAGRDAAAQFLAQFRSQRFAAITIDSAQHTSPMAELQHYGTLVDTMGKASPTEVPSTDALASHSGLTLKLPQASSIPEALRGTRRYYITPEAELRFTLDRAKATAYLSSIGKGDFVFPQKMDGVSLIVNVPKTALIAYGDNLAAMDKDQTLAGGASPKQLIIGQSNLVTAGTDGKVSLDELRDFLLSLPGLPADTVRQLRSIQDWRTTLPIPVGISSMTWRDATIAGNQGLLFGDVNGRLSAGIWQANNTLFGVGGTITTDELMKVAAGLQ